LLQTQPAETPIRIYKIVQTGAKTQLGGLKKGLSKVVNQSFTELWVAKLERNPMARHMVTLTAIRGSLLFNFLLFGSKVRIYFN